MPADVDSIWAALQQGAQGSSAGGRPGKGQHRILRSSKQQAQSQPVENQQSNLQLPALRLEAALQKLQSKETSEKLAALQALKASSNILKEEHSQTCLSELGKALILRLSDPKEQIRILACTLLVDVIQINGCHQADLLPYAMPLLVQRLETNPDHQAPLEACEEVRQSLQVLLRMWATSTGQDCQEYVGHIIICITAGCNDGSQAVNLEACSSIRALYAVHGRRLGPLGKPLIAAASILLTHPKYKVRVAALEAIKQAVLLGRHEMIYQLGAFQDPNLVPIAAFYVPTVSVNFLSKLAQDGSPQVRKAFVEAVGEWLVSLHERIEHQPRLLPYLLGGLCDDIASVRDISWCWLSKAGKLHIEDHAADLKDSLQYLPSEATSSGWQQEGAADRAYGRDGKSGILHERLKVAPPPARPELGLRLLVQSHAFHLLVPLSAELSSWREEHAVCAARLLRVCLFMVEEEAEAHLSTLLPAMCKALQSNPGKDNLHDACNVTEEQIADFDDLVGSSAWRNPFDNI
ncbi:hypothetical protein WJX84_009211 [Apatococcus fuscideae]|uniref:Uncharacterized protein n=1 Tax=Apatococcus fuscideae TaxID=2026836 RepID=A0AAW1SNI7_9CHLO